MVHFTVFVALGVTLVQSFSAATPSPCLNGLCNFTRRSLTAAQVVKELGSQLSSASSIYGPGDPRYVNETQRYQNYNPPHIQVVVVPSREEDIPKIVLYANANSIPFWARNRGHALIGNMGDFTGLQIDLRSLMGITINPGGKTAQLQGGTYDQQVIDELWHLGYVGTTGSCACVGLMGPGLGGGYGRYQGLYGLVSDNVVAYNVVLANGTAVTASDTENADLLWAMRGAGHNFGIVTSFELKIYPKLVDTWYFKNYIWTQDKIEAVFREINRLNNGGRQPVHVANQGATYLMVPSVSTTEPVLSWSFSYSGPQEDAQQYLSPFDAIPAAVTQDGNVPYTDIPTAQGSGMNDPICAVGYEHLHAHAAVQQWNITAQRQIYNLFRAKIQEEPAANSSVITMEGYSTQGVTAVKESTSSYPWRNSFNMLGFVSINYLPNPALDSWADNWRKQTRELWYQGEPGGQRITYVNYAFGDEPIDTIYGPPLPRLRQLKAKFDPHGRFNYYNPITPLR